MDWSAALQTFVITLREGVEATLVVGIVLAYLSKAGQTHLNRWVYAGVAAGLGASGLVGIAFRQIIQTVQALNPQSARVLKPALEGIFSVAAIALLSWMLIWMTQQARQMKAQVEETVSASLTGATGTGWSLFGLIFFAVLREGFETVVFLTAQFQQGWVPLVGAAAGLSSAVAIGILLFAVGVKVNLRQFFQVMGVLLLLIVAGLVISALGKFDTTIARLAPDQHLCVFRSALSQTQSCILGPRVWNLHEILPDRQFPGIILHTLFGYVDRLYLVQAVGYVVFWLTIGSAYLRSLATPKPTPAKTV